MKIPSGPRDAKPLKGFLSTVRRHVCGLADCLTEPWKTHYDDALANMLGSAMDTMIQKNAKTVATPLNSTVGVEIERRFTEGALFKPGTSALQFEKEVPT